MRGRLGDLYREITVGIIGLVIDLFKWLSGCNYLTDKLSNYYLSLFLVVVVVVITHMLHCLSSKYPGNSQYLLRFIPDIILGTPIYRETLPPRILVNRVPKFIMPLNCITACRHLQIKRVLYL